MPIAETPWAASCVPVNLDSTEMDSPVQVIQKPSTVLPEDNVSSKLMIYIVLIHVQPLAICSGVYVYHGSLHSVYIQYFIYFTRSCLLRILHICMQVRFCNSVTDFAVTLSLQDLSYWCKIYEFFRGRGHSKYAFYASQLCCTTQVLFSCICCVLAKKTFRKMCESWFKYDIMLKIKVVKPW